MPRPKSGPGLWYRAVLRLKQALGMKVFLCDSCQYDWRGACRYPQRPNAVWCPDYRKRGK